MKRIVVTGMGLVTPLGCGVEPVWRRLLAGETGIVALPQAMIEGLACTIGAVVPAYSAEQPLGLDVDQLMDRNAQKATDRYILLALAAAEQALKQAAWQPQDPRLRARTATVVASGVGGFASITQAVRVTDQLGPRQVSPFTMPSFMANMAAGAVSARYRFTGPLGAPVTACAAGVQAIGDAARLIRTGEADIALCGGADACIDRVSLGVFAAAQKLSTGFNQSPWAASRPFDRQRDGFVVGEGAGMWVIESLEHALYRGATPLVELVGYGTSADASETNRPSPYGEGAQRAMWLALQQAGVPPQQVQHLNAHAASTPLGDRSERAAIRAVFGHRPGPAVSATKSATGHLLGAAGTVEAVFAALALRDQLAPPTCNYAQGDDDDAPMDVVHGAARPMAIEYAMSNGIGFGGVNASVLLRRWH